MSDSIVEQIKQLKQEKNAIILAHYYQNPEIQDIADYADIYDYENDKHLINIDTDKYDITIDDKVIDKQLRHTLMYYGEQF